MPIPWYRALFQLAEYVSCLYPEGMMVRLTHDGGIQKANHSQNVVGQCGPDRFTYVIYYYVLTTHRQQRISRYTVRNALE